MRAVAASARPGARRGLTVVEVLVALCLLTSVLGFLLFAMVSAGRGAARAEWEVAQTRKLEAFEHVLSQELARANHLITLGSDGATLNDPRFSACWVLEGGRAVSFRVFQPDQVAADPYRVDLAGLKQDQVLFALREDELVFVRKGGLTEPVVRVLLTDVRTLRFSPGREVRAEGMLDGLLRVEVEVRPDEGSATVRRELALPVGVPVLVEGLVPAGVEVIDPPRTGPRMRLGGDEAGGDG